MVYLDRVETEWPLRVQFSVGARVPLYCTASGKMYLSTLSDPAAGELFAQCRPRGRDPQHHHPPDALRAELETIREQGFSVDNEEFLDGVIAFAMPLRDKYGRMPATISFQGPTQRMSIEQGYQHLPRLKRAAEELSALL
jgi:DNA-binding IclR family transcriptional regulator